MSLRWELTVQLQERLWKAQVLTSLEQLSCSSRQSSLVSVYLPPVHCTFHTRTHTQFVNSQSHWEFANWASRFPVREAFKLKKFSLKNFERNHWVPEIFGNRSQCIGLGKLYNHTQCWRNVYLVWWVYLPVLWSCLSFLSVCPNTTCHWIIQACIRPYIITFVSVFFTYPSRWAPISK